MADRDAAFREALEAYASAAIARADWAFQSDTESGDTGDALTRADLTVTLNRVLALYAERQGEVYEVRGRITGPDGMTLELWTDDAGLPWLGLGTRVRVTREEGK